MWLVVIKGVPLCSYDHYMVTTCACYPTLLCTISYQPGPKEQKQTIQTQIIYTQASFIFLLIYFLFLLPIHYSFPERWIEMKPDYLQNVSAPKVYIDKYYCLQGFGPTG